MTDFTKAIIKASRKTTSKRGRKALKLIRKQRRRIHLTQKGKTLGRN